MGVVSWLQLQPLLLLSAAALLAVRAPTASAGPAPSVDPPLMHVVSEVDDPAMIDKVTAMASRLGAVYVVRATPNPKDPCLASVQRATKRPANLIYITASQTCYDEKPNKYVGLFRLQYDNTTSSLKGNDDTLKEQLEKLAAQSIKVEKEEGILVPLWSIIAVGVVVGALMAGNCIFFNMLRQSRMRTHPADDNKKSGKSAASKTSGGSKRSTTSEKNKKNKVSAGSSSKSSKSSSKSVKKSSKAKKAAKKNESCRSSKSLSTKSCVNAAGPTSVKVVAVAPPKKETTPLPKDEVATVMQTRGGTASLPERSLDRVRASLPPTTHRPTATVPPPPPPCCSGGPGGAPRTTAITTQPRGPPIVPTVSVMGSHGGPVSPFEVLARDTSPLPPASTPAVMAAAQTAYSTRSATSVVGSTQPSHTPPQPTVTPPQPPPTSVVVVPTTTTVSHASASSSSSSSCSVPSVVTVSSSVPPATITPSAPPPPVSLVPMASLSSVIPLTVTSIPPPTVPTSPVTVAPPVPPTTTTLPISPAYSLASTPGSGSSHSSSREKAPISKRSQRK